MRCEYCQKEYPVDDERQVGQEIRCPHCGIPSVCSDRRVLIICPECHKELEGELWMLGNEADCTHCGKPIILSRPENPGDDYSNSYLPANYQLGNYVIKKCLGVGGMGEVYLAHHIFLDRLCALKLLHPNRSGIVGDISIDALVREARLACQINSPYIVDVMDVQVDSQRNLGYIVMEYVKGQDIEDIICEGPMSEDYVLKVARGVCQALMAAAAFDVVHRDIKPANILITDEGDIKLADLGIAKAGKENTSSNGKRLTGTINYAAPEQLLSADNVDARTDIYSLGATMYHMLSGRRPFEGSNAKAMISKILKGERLPLAKVAPQVSKSCCKLVASMMSVDMNKRPANAKKLFVILDRLIQKRSQSKLSYFFRCWIAPFFKSWKGYAVTGAAAVILTLVTTLLATGAFSSHGKKEPAQSKNPPAAAAAKEPVKPQSPQTPAAILPQQKAEAADPAPQVQEAVKTDVAPQTQAAAKPAPQAQEAVKTDVAPQTQAAAKPAPQVQEAVKTDVAPQTQAAAKPAPQAQEAEKTAAAPPKQKAAQSSSKRKSKGSAPKAAAEAGDDETPAPVKRPVATTDEVIPAEVEQFSKAIKATAAGKVAQKIIQTQIAQAEAAAKKAEEEEKKAEAAKKAAAKAKNSSKTNSGQGESPSDPAPQETAPQTAAPQAAAPVPEAPKEAPKAAPAPNPDVAQTPVPAAFKGGDKVNFIRLIILLCWVFSSIKVLAYLENKRHKSNAFVIRNEGYLNLAALVAGPIVYLIVEFNTRFGEKMKRLSKTNEQLPDIVDSHGNNAFADDSSGNETVYYVRKMLAKALRLHASDIFIDPKTGEIAVLRFRVDGALRVIEEFNFDFSAQVINVLKVAAGMDISERRRPQDGAFSLKGPFGDVSLRVATVGAFSGEKVALRILGDESGPKSLADAGLTGQDLAVMEQAPRLSSGMVLICGPTGSGKTTTLYAMLNSIDYSIKNVVSIEDPIEHVVPAISQMEVNEPAGIGFSELLRNALRQNPDIICLGEIRDEDTAQTAIHAAQTGHLIIATLHSNDNIGTIDRLANLNIPLRSIAGTLRLVVSQRLVRKLCTCKKGAALSEADKDQFGKFGIDCSKTYVPKGCSKCGNTGYSGRAALFDILKVDDDLRELLEDEHTNLSNIQKRLKASASGNAMIRSGYRMVAKGITSLEEVKRVTME